MRTGELIIASDGYPAMVVGPWAREKLHYVRGYCSIFEGGMKHKWPTRTYIDLFAGPGRCIVDDSGEEIDGSPLVALKTQVPFTHYFFNDADPRVTEALTSRIAAIGSPNVRISTRECNEVIDELAKRLPRSSLDFCFIDPFAWEIRFESIRKLTEGRRIDLLITFHCGSMKRVVDNPPTELHEFFGDTTWQTEYKAARATGRREGTRILLDAYESRLRNLGYVFIGDRPSISSRRNVLLYHMVFASKHERGADFWEKISRKTVDGQMTMDL